MYIQVEVQFTIQHTLEELREAFVKRGHIPDWHVIEGVETHTRTGFMNLLVPSREPGAGEPDTVRIPLTHVKIFGWYDNEMGSYTHRLGELTEHVARSM